MPPHVFGIDSERLFYGQFPTTNGSGRHLGEFRSVELDGDSFAEGPLGGVLRDPAALRKSVESLVKTIAGSIQEASLVMPDAWLRLAFTELDQLPRKPAEREELLRWKLKMQVPYRVDDLRLAAEPVPGLGESEGEKRLLLSFGIDQLIDQIEESFAHSGIRLGHISNQSLSLMNALHKALGSLDLAAVALVSENSYSLFVAERGAPVLHRFKAYQADLPDDAKRRFVQRDLRLTRSFLAEKVGHDRLGRIVLVSPEDVEPIWSEWLGDVFETRPRLLVQEWPFLRAPGSRVPSYQLAPLFGAACREVA